MRNILLIIIVLLCNISLYGQSIKEIYEIQETGASSALTSQVVTTQGIVTATFPGSNSLNGFFMQSATTNGSNASDGIFIYLGNTTFSVAKGDAVEVTGTVTEYQNRTQISNVSVCKIKSHDNTILPTKVVFDENFKTNAERYENMLLEFDQTFTVISNRYLKQFGQLSLSGKRLQSPTEVTIPGSTKYTTLKTSNSMNQIILDDASSVSYPTPTPFTDINGTRRTGECTDSLVTILDQNVFGYVLYALDDVVFYKNQRPTQPENLGNYNLKVCCFNLEYYLRENWGTGYGPDNEADANRQHSKILKALQAIDADIYGLVEIQTGQTALQYLTDALNTSAQNDIYAYINDGTSTYGSYTKVGFIYRKDKVAPIKEIRSDNTETQNRKKAQCFNLISNNESFIFSLNHFKSKSGGSYATADNVDKGDGQSYYNGDRVREANATVSFVNVCATYYNEPDILIMGDLNAYAKEDPLQVFYNYNYTHLLKQFHGDEEYSYSYNSEAGCLDHVLANSSLKQQITGCSVFHINTDEPSYFEYNQTPFYDNMYRCSDHDPIVVGLQLGVQNVVNTPINNIFVYPNPSKGVFTISNALNYHLIITDMLGRKFYSSDIPTNIEPITTYLPQGIYLLNFVHNNSKITKKLVVN